jgi:hypothetical protein
MFLAAPPAADTNSRANRAAEARAVEALIQETQAALDRVRGRGEETWQQRSARRSLALSRQLLAIGNARVAESMALDARRVLQPADRAGVRP